jgi:signal transduction histidine kinase
MMKVLRLLAELSDPDRRRQASIALAKHLDAEDLILLVADPHTGTYVPGNEFPEILPQSEAWQTFVKGCVREGEQQGELFRPEDGRPIRAHGFRLTDGSVLVLLGGSPNVSTVRYCCLLLPLVTEVMRKEYAIQMLSLEATMARGMADEMRARAEGVVAMERDFQQAALESLAIRKSTEDTLRQLCARLLKREDDWRRRTSSQLRGSARQYLTGILTTLGAALREPPTIGGSLASRISNALEMIERCNSNIKAISYSLHSPLLDDMGLVPAIVWCAEEFSERSGIRVELDMPRHPPRLPEQIETVLFRVVEEGLSNIHLHSGSRTARIKVAIGAGKATLQISDEGHGISSERASQFQADVPTLGVGISGMRERIRELDGQMTLQSSASGLMVEVSLSFHENHRVPPVSA